MRTRVIGATAGFGGIAVMTAALRLVGVVNATTIALSYLLVVLSSHRSGCRDRGGDLSVAMLCSTSSSCRRSARSRCRPAELVALAFLVVGAWPTGCRRRRAKAQKPWTAATGDAPSMCRATSCATRARGAGAMRATCRAAELTRSRLASRRRVPGGRARRRGGAASNHGGPRSCIRLVNGHGGTDARTVVWRAPRIASAGPVLAPVRVGARAVEICHRWTCLERAP